MDHTQPPANPEIEQALLGAILIDPSLMPIIDGLVTPADFYAERHAWIFEAMQHLAVTSSVDYVLLCRLLEDRGRAAIRRGCCRPGHQATPGYGCRADDHDCTRHRQRSC